MTNERQNLLARQWAAISEGAGDAIHWVDAVRQNSKRLNSEADNLIHRLRQTRNKARNLERACETPMTIGFFGVSQAGKSFLISALGAAENGEFEALYGQQRVNFIDHINPPGSGKEATGLVTRFTRRTQEAEDAAFPIEVRLFREIDLAKILSNAWFNDFDQNKVEYRLDESRIEALLERFAGREQAPLQAGVDEDDVVSLWDYARTSFERPVRALGNGYWQRAMQLAPHLAPDERAQLFSLLWGELPELTRAYAENASSLRKLSNAETAFLPLSALTSNDNGKLQYNRDSIMCVDALIREEAGQEKTIAVRPVIAGKLAPSVEVRVSHLATLTTELVFPRFDPPRETTMESVDLLDFPGYRGRYKASQLEDIAADGNPVAQLLLRGKVAYLFESYTDSQAMNGLVLCTPEQSDVSDIANVLERWVDRTQGETPQTRGQHQCGLFWAITKFDIRIQNMLRMDGATQIEEGWFGLVQGAIEERYGNLDFMRTWKSAEGRESAFNNTFLVRKPGIEGSFIKLNGAVEEFDQDKQPKLELLADSFAGHEAVKRRFADPAAAWNAVLTPNDGGMKYLAGAIAPIANIEFKLGRLQQQLEQERDQEQGILARLAKYHQNIDGDSVEQKAALGQKLAETLYGRRHVVPELQHTLKLDNESLRELYLGGLHQPASTQNQEPECVDEPAEISPYGLAMNTAESNPFSMAASSADNPFGSTVAASPVKTALKTLDNIYAEAVFQKWIAHLRDLPERKRLRNALGISLETAEALVDELIVAANRINLQEKIEKALLSRQDGSSKREHVVMRQVLRAQTVLNDFIAWLSFLEIPAEDRPASIINKQKLFVNTTQLDDAGLPALQEQPVDTNADYVGSWLTGLVDLVKNNAGHAAGSDITLDQNQTLGRIIEQFRAA